MKVAGGSRLPIVPIAIVGGVVVVVVLLIYLITQTGKGSNASAADKAAEDQSGSIPGTFVPSQGRGHFPGGYSPNATPVPFCTGVAHSEAAANASSGTVAATATAAGTATLTPTEVVHGSGTPGTTPGVPTNCYNANPPASGRHLNVQRNVDVGGGNLIKIPPDPIVFPSEVVVPRAAIPHILEHAGVYVGYHCKDGDGACDDAVQKLGDLVNGRIDNHDNRVVMSRDPDLPEGTIGLSSWTRVLDVNYQDFDAMKGEIDRFIGKNSCRVDFEGFCR